MGLIFHDDPLLYIVWFSKSTQGNILSSVLQDIRTIVESRERPLQSKREQHERKYKALGVSKTPERRQVQEGAYQFFAFLRPLIACNRHGTSGRVAWYNSKPSISFVKLESRVGGRHVCKENTYSRVEAYNQVLAMVCGSIF